MMKNVIYFLLVLIIAGCAGKRHGREIPQNFDYGKVEAGHFRNDFFDLDIWFNKEWHVQSKRQTEQLVDKGADLIVSKNEDLKEVIEVGKVNSAYLLTLFKNPVGESQEFNPSFLLMAENLANVPQIKDGESYLIHCKKLLKQTGLPYVIDEELETLKIGPELFYCMKASLSGNGRSIRQDYFCTVMNGFSLSMILSYATDGEKREMYEIMDKVRIGE